MSVKLRTSRDAPPTKAPSTSGWLISSRAFDGLTLPPYWMRTYLAIVSSNIEATTWRTKAWADWACSVVAV